MRGYVRWFFFAMGCVLGALLQLGLVELLVTGLALSWCADGAME